MGNVSCPAGMEVLLPAETDFAGAETSGLAGEIFAFTGESGANVSHLVNDNEKSRTGSTTTWTACGTVDMDGRSVIIVELTGEGRDLISRVVDRFIGIGNATRESSGLCWSWMTVLSGFVVTSMIASNAV